MKTSAGLVIIYDNKMLLVHPTNAPWYGTYSIPKGEINEGENFFDAAIRETEEEIGIKFRTENIVCEKPLCIDYRDKQGKTYKKVWYYITRLTQPLDYVEFKLQPEEVDWAGFLDKEEAEKRILPKLKDVLLYLK